MFGTTKIGRAFGIDFFVHGTFWLLPLVVILGGLGGPAGDLEFSLALLFAVFGCVALHELGHAAAAALFGIRTRDITLLPIGGVARLERMPDRPLPELVIALAGPAVNVVIAGLLLLALAAVRPLGADSWARPGVGVQFLAELLRANVFLVLFNLIPAFPMDGGRVLRALAQFVTSRVRATEIAAGVGAVCAAGLLLVAVFTTNVMLGVLAVMVFLMGQAELAGVRREVRRVPPDDDFGEPPVVTVTRPVDGWRWDGRLRAWVEYRDGRPLRAWQG